MQIITCTRNMAGGYLRHALPVRLQSARDRNMTYSGRESYAMHEQSPYEPFFDFPCSPTFRAYEAEITHGEVVASQMYPRYQKEALEATRAVEASSDQGNGLRNIQTELSHIKARLDNQANKLENHLEASRNWVRRDRL